MLKTYSFLPESSAAARLIKSRDWTETLLGPPSFWPSTLKSTLSLMMFSRHPMFLWWGPDFKQFYNDAYIPCFGIGKHPTAMGQSGEECWKEIWEIISPQIHDAFNDGKASWFEDKLVPILRNGKMEEVYWTYGCSPVADHSGTICGVLVVCTETTATVLAIKRLKEERTALAASEKKLKLSQLAYTELLEHSPLGIAMLEGPEHTFSFANKLYLSLIFGGRSAEDFIGKTVRQVVPEVEGQGFFERLDEVYRTGEAFVGTNVPLSVSQSNGEDKKLFVSFKYQAKHDSLGAIDGILVLIYEVIKASPTREAFHPKS